MRQKEQRLWIILLISWTIVLTLVAFCHAETEIDLSLTSISGSTEAETFATAFKTTGNKGFLSGNFRHQKVDETQVEEKGTLRCGYDPEINSWLSLWFFGEAGYNDAIGLKSEYFIGGGPKWKIWTKDKDAVSLSAGVLSHYTRFQEKPSERLVRGSLRGKIFLTSDSLEFAIISFYKPNLDDSDDYILQNEMSLRYKLTGIVGLKFSIQEEYRSVLDEDECVTTLALNIRM